MDKENLQFKSIPENTEENEVIFWYVWGRGGLFTYTSYKIGYIEVLQYHVWYSYVSISRLRRHAKLSGCSLLMFEKL
jgi:hypothetical protein